MKHNLSLKALARVSTCALAFVGCATIQPPHELVAARAEYEAADKGPTKTVNPSGLYEGKKLLDRANSSFSQDPSSTQARDFGYLALRKVQLAEATAGITLAHEKMEKAAKDRQASTEGALATTRTELAAANNQQRADAVALQSSNDALASSKEALDTEKLARQDADRKADEATANLAKIALVKQEARGMVITLSGSVLFKSNNASLLPNAHSRLDEIAQALQLSDHKRFVVEGHTDSRGSDSGNQALSLRRAQTVRDYLVDRGVSGERITATGYGRSRPVAENETAEGRANNRRVEIVIAPVAL